MRLLAHLAGDVPEMAAAEYRAVLEAHGAPLTTLHAAPRFLDGHAEIFADEAPRVVSRLGLAHSVAMHLFDGAPGRWSEGARDCCFPTGIPFAARAARVDPEAPWAGPDLEREVGALLAVGRPVDLERPRLVARIYALRDRAYVGQELWAADAKALAERHVDRRPHSSPVSLEPRLARALVNLTRAAPGERLLDPLCGTGGILLEAAALGLEAWGSDLDPDMVEGARANLAHFGLRGNVFASDVGDAPRHLAARGAAPVDAVATDLPYGRSSTLHREPRDRLYARTFEAIASVLKPRGNAVVGLPHGEPLDALGSSLELVDEFRVRAHRSLTRRFVRLRRQ